MLTKEVLSISFKVFGVTQPGIKPQSPRPLANTLPTRPMSRFSFYIYVIAWTLIFDRRFHLVLSQQLSGRERNILEKLKKTLKIQSKEH